LAHSDPSILRSLFIEIYRILEIPVQLLQAKTFEETYEIVKKGFADISVIDFGFEAGHGEDLITMIRAKTPHHPIIVLLDAKDATERLELTHKYYPLICLTTKMFCSRLDDYLKKAIMDLRFAPQRIALRGMEEIKTVDVLEICYLESIANTKYLEVTLYDFEKKIYRTEQHRSTMAQFLEEYNEEGYFIQCHNSYIVNKKMIGKVLPARADNLIVLLYPDDEGYPVEILMSEKYKKMVLKELKGLY